MWQRSLASSVAGLCPFIAMRAELSLCVAAFAVISRVAVALAAVVAAVVVAVMPVVVVAVVAEELGEQRCRPVPIHRSAS